MSGGWLVSMAGTFDCAPHAGHPHRLVQVCSHCHGSDTGANEPSYPGIFQVSSYQHPFDPKTGRMAMSIIKVIRYYKGNGPRCGYREK